ncbi:MAG: ABC transporter ATP-binding protein [Burkholderiaceae bacterium]|nr:ABC transporter ATP-binding protein [Burkholderiaceae bacterium]
MGASVALQGVGIAYSGKNILADVTHRFDPGCHLIEGANGVGKSTLLGAIAGHVRYKGRILINGHDLCSEPVKARRGLTYVPDNPIFHSFFTGYEFIDFVLGAHDRGQACRQHDFERLVQHLGVQAHLGNRFNEASLGTRRKFFLLAAFLLSPGAMVLDEPFNGLDAGAAEALRQLLIEVSADQVVLLTCHQPSLVTAALSKRWTLRHPPHVSVLPSEATMPGGLNG